MDSLDQALQGDSLDMALKGDSLDEALASNSLDQALAASKIMKGPTVREAPIDTWPLPALRDQRDSYLDSIGTGVQQVKTVAAVIDFVWDMSIWQYFKNRRDKQLGASNITPESAQRINADWERYNAEISANIDKSASNYQEQAVKLAGRPVPSSIQELQKAKGAMQTIDVLLNRGSELAAHTLLQSVPMMVPALVTMMFNPIAGTLAMGGTSLLAEGAMASHEYMQKQGVNVKDKEAIKAFWADPAKAKAAMDYGVAKGLPIAVMDLFGAGLASIKLAPKLKLGSTKLAEGVAQVTVGIGTDAGGEILGQANANKGFDNIDWTDVILEALPGAVTGPIEHVLLSGKGEDTNRPQRTPVEPLYSQQMELPGMDVKQPPPNPNNPYNQLSLQFNEPVEQNTQEQNWEQLDLVSDQPPPVGTQGELFDDRPELPGHQAGPPDLRMQAEANRAQAMAQVMRHYESPNEYNDIQPGFMEKLRMLNRVLDNSRVDGVDKAELFYMNLAKEEMLSPTERMLASRIGQTLFNIERQIGIVTSMFKLRPTEYHRASEASMGGTSVGERGFYDPTDPMNHKLFFKDGVLGNSVHRMNGWRMETILHEGVHSVTDQIVWAYEHYPEKFNTPEMKRVKEQLDVLNSLYNRLMNNKTFMKEKAQGNSMDNLSEFLTWGLTNPNFRATMQKIKVGKYNNLLTEFVHTILKMLGFEKQNLTSGYELMLSIFDDVTNKRQKLSRIGIDIKHKEAPRLQREEPSFKTEPIKDPYTVLAVSESAWSYANGGRYNRPFAVFTNLMKNVPVPENYSVEGAYLPEISSGRGRPGAYDYPYSIVKKNNVVQYIVMNWGDPFHFAAAQQHFNHDVVTPADAAHMISNDIDLKTLKEKADLYRNLRTVKPIVPEDDVFGDITDPVLAKKLALVHPDLPTNMTDMFSGGPTTKAVLTNNPIVKWLRAQVAQVITAQSKMARGFITDLDTLKLKMTKEELIDVISFLNELDIKKQDYTPDMGARFTDTQRKFIEKVRESNAFIYKLWNSKRAEIGLDPIKYRPGHMPGVFRGDYRAVVKSADGETLGIIAAVSQRQFERYKAQVEAQMPGVIIGEPRRTGLAQSGAINPNMFDVFDSIEKYLSTDTEASKKLSDILTKMMKEDANYILGIGVHEEFKKGVFGNEGNKPWLDAKTNAQEAFESYITYLEDAAYHHTMIPIADNLAKMINDPQLRTERPKLVKYLEMYYTHSTRKPPAGGINNKMYKMTRKMGQGVDSTIDAVLEAVGVGPNQYRYVQSVMRSVFATFVMGFFNFAFAALQIAQVPTFGLLGAMSLRGQYNIPMYKGRLAATEAGVSMLLHFMEWSTNKALSKFGKEPIELITDPETKQAIKYAEDHGLINLSELEKAQEATMNSFQRKLDLGLNFSQRASEASTRPYVFMWYYKTLRAGGMSVEQALERARNATQFSMAAYHSLERPAVFQAMGSTGPLFGQLKTFAMSAMAQEWFYAKSAFKRGDPKLFAGLILTYLLVYGLENAPGYDELDNVVRRVTGNTGISEHVKAHVPEWVAYGLISHQSNIDIQGRLRFPSIVNMSNMAKAGSLSEMPGAFLSDMISMMPALQWFSDNMKQTMKFIADPTKANNQAAAYAWAPSSVKGFAEEKFFKGPDGELWRKDDMAPVRDRTERDWQLRRYGLRSLTDRLEGDAVREAREDRKAADDRRVNLTKAFKRGMVSKKDPFTPETFEKWVGSYLDAGGDPKNLKQAYKDAMINSMMTDRDRVTGIKGKRVPERFWFFHDNK